MTPEARARLAPILERLVDAVGRDEAEVIVAIASARMPKEGATVGEWAVMLRDAIARRYLTETVAIGSIPHREH